MSVPRILFLAPVMPAQGGNGLAMRAGLFLDGLARAGAVHVLVIPVFGGAASPSDETRRLAAAVRVLSLERDPDLVGDLSARLATPSQRLRAIAVHPRPALCRSATLAAAEAVARAGRSADMVHVMRTYLVPYLDVLLEASSRPKVTVDVDDVESTTFRRLGDREEADRYQALEAHYLPLVDRVVTCSADDARALADHLALRAVTPVPNAVRPTPGGGVAAPDARHDLVFVGNLSYAPNADAARWLCATVLPLLGAVTVAIVGSAPGPEVTALARDPRVTIAADVPAVGPWYAGARLAVVPIHAGGGTRTKVLEAFAHGRPVVATSLAVEGLAAGQGGGSVILADDAESFAAACRRLLDDSRLRARLATEGREMVDATATVGVVAASIGRLVRHTLSP